MKKKFVASFLAAVVVLFGAALPAQAAIYKTTVIISAPKYVAAGIPATVDVSVCPYATRSSTSCEWSADRSVTLFANKKKVAVAKTVYGLAAIKWTPATSGKYSLTASVAAVTGFNAATATAVSVTVSKKTSATPISMRFCNADTCHTSPMTMAFDDNWAQMSGLLGNGASAKNRTAHLQYANTKNAWYTYLTKKTAMNSDFAQYSADFSLQFDSADYCDVGDETYSWSFRVIVDGTSKYAPVAGPTSVIDYECGGSGSGTGGGSLGLSYSYPNQTIDSSFQSVPSIDVSVSDPDLVGYALYSLYCNVNDDCTSTSNWWEMSSLTGTGDDFFSMGADWGLGMGTYQVQVVMYPDDGSSSIEGSISTVTIF